MTVKWWPVLVALACCYSIRRRTVMGGSTSVRLDVRPVPSNDPGAVPDLIEMPNPALDPRPADLNVTALLAKLGAKFDKNYMSVMTPEHIVPVDDIPFRSVALTVSALLFRLSDGCRHGLLFFFIPPSRTNRNLRKLI